MNLISSTTRPDGACENPQVYRKLPQLSIEKPASWTAAAASALALFVAAILADNPHNALAADDFAVATNTFYRCTNFHGFTYIKSITAANPRGRALSGWPFSSGPHIDETSSGPAPAP
jgi:hypothetical protein